MGLESDLVALSLDELRKTRVAGVALVGVMPCHGGAAWLLRSEWLPWCTHLERLPERLWHAVRFARRNTDKALHR